MPEVYPDHLEAGTQNSPGLAGLAAGVEWILDHRVEALAAREQQLKQQLLDGLSGLPDVRIVSTNQPGDVALVTMVHNRFPSDELALRVERSHGIQGRPGLHCAPDTHAVLGTLRDGAFRLSIGWATTGVEIDQVIEAIRALE
jgi:selenocysteine lyase/cysteine desulfurase